MTKIAIIEDDSTISQMYRMKFEADGFDVRMAGNGAIGVDVVERFRPDIILLDIQMPEMDGVEALKIIRSHDWGKTIPVIVLTNLGEEEAPADMRSLGISGYIVKANLTPRQVVAQVKSVVETKHT
ncbi:MAG: response regulator [Candidatus Saccharibacteria bacterium]|nr:response regulator [Candidatus Saccharibacteria bacterium]